MKNEIRFKTIFKLAPSQKIAIEREFSLGVEEGKDETSLVYDEVLFGALDAINEEFPEDDFPKLDIIGFEIFDESGGKWCPVISEGQQKANSPETKEFISGCEKYLVLPEDEWSISDEFKKYSELVEAGIDVGDFDPEKMKKLIEIEKKNG